MHPIKHLKTVNRHRREVFRLCKKAGIPGRGLLHDLSKYSPVEFSQGAKYFVGTKSPNVLEREERGYSTAWLHHKGRNRHHFEYWQDYSPTKRMVVPVKMPLVFVIEMFCDRIAASKIYKGNDYTDSSALEYFLGGKDHRFIHPDTSDLLERLLVMLAQKGETATFFYIRNELLPQKEY